jgi:hypothetical protein
MTEIQTQKREVKRLSELLARHHSELQIRIEVYSREQRQLSVIQQNVLNVQNVSEELLVALEKIKLF